MAEKVETVEREPVAVTPTVAPEPEPVPVRLSREELPGVMAALGISREVLAGALHGVRGETFTVDQARSLVDKFLKRRVR